MVVAVRTGVTDAPTSPWRAVVVDDEPLARQTLELLVAREGDFVVLQPRAVTGAEAIDVVNAQQPDVLFLDVQMPEVDGFDVIRQLDRGATVAGRFRYRLRSVRASGVRTSMRSTIC